MNDILVRKAEIKDLDYVLLLSDQLTFSDLPYDREVDIHWSHTDEGKEYYIEKINCKGGICFVAELNKNIVGYATAAVKETPSYRLVKVAELENLVVSKKLRNKGIGKVLLNKFIEWAKEAGANRVCVNVFSLNEKGVEFYKREGFLSFESILEMPLNANTGK